MGKRVDNVLLIGNTVVVIEFKVGSKAYERAAKRQTVDYALDLKNFHEGSREATIVPVLAATHAPDHPITTEVGEDGLADLIPANARTLSQAIRRAIDVGSGPAIEPQAWLDAGYHPTPTIIEASQALYRGHAVSEITRTEAGADNLGATTGALSRIIDQARTTGDKVICFVTGVPGAGKTLAGLNLASERRRVDTADIEHAVFLSGNGPLVKVLQEALSRDKVQQAKNQDNHISRTVAMQEAKAFIQNIHHFRDEYVRNPAPPIDRVVVFDEAQRAWNLSQTSKFMQQKRGLADFGRSEPAFLIGAMDRHKGWAVIVCLVGGGQEINVGEAGMEEWLCALRDYYPAWAVRLPDQIADDLYLPSMRLEELGDRVHRIPNLHLGVSIRSFRSERLSAGIDALLSGSSDTARERLASILDQYPIRITRSLETAKAWIRQRARGTERYGLLASSGARRLKPLGIIASGMKGKECNWFLDDDQDVRSSYYLEDAASEFEIQGLELDWSILVWGGDFIHTGHDWLCRAFKGSNWQTIRKQQAKRYRLNAYRVLLTRARQGLAIVVPCGDPTDHTRLPEHYDATWGYLVATGLNVF
jgi:Schlafen group 3, DNA/RNA helicase domain